VIAVRPGAPAGGHHRGAVAAAVVGRWPRFGQFASRHRQSREQHRASWAGDIGLPRWAASRRQCPRASVAPGSAVALLAAPTPGFALLGILAVLPGLILKPGHHLWPARGVGHHEVRRTVTNWSLAGREWVAAEVTDVSEVALGCISGGHMGLEVQRFQWGHHLGGAVC
jgi:hypothetical protein